jgi:hypothetical protein
MTATKALALACMAVICSNATAQWRYSTEADKMTGTTTHWAEVKSDNSLSLDFPYKGSNYGRLYFRQRDGKSPEAFVTIEKGQILCRTYDNCSVRVRFDESPPVRMSAAPAADHSSEIIFISPPAKFLSSAQKAKRILIELSLYQNGNQVLEFATPEPLTLPKRSKK